MSKVPETQCSVDDCSASVHVRGMCVKHYSRLRRWGSADGRPPDPELPGEVWRPIPGYAEYEASSEGRVRFIGPVRRGGPYPGTMVSPTLNHDGYLRTKAYGRGSVFVHRLIALAFLGECPEGHEVNHKDAVKQNNRPGNLEYVTHKENMLHAADRGLMHHLGRATLRASEIRAIRRLRRLGVAQSDLAYAFEIDPSSISVIVNRKSWKHVD